MTKNYKPYITFKNLIPVLYVAKKHHTTIMERTDRNGGKKTVLLGRPTAMMKTYATAHACVILGDEGNLHN